MDKNERKMNEEIRRTPLAVRIDLARGMIGKMCEEGRPPAMTIPPQPKDEDVFIDLTLQDAAKQLEQETIRDRFAMALAAGFQADPGFDASPNNSAVVAYEFADAMLEARKGKPEEKKDQFVRPDLLLAGNTTPKEIQKALDDPRYKTVSVESDNLHGVHVPVGKSLTVRPPTKEGPLCRSCDKPIRHNGKFWEHVGMTPRHPAVLKKGSL